MGGRYLQINVNGKNFEVFMRNGPCFEDFFNLNLKIQEAATIIIGYLRQFRKASIILRATVNDSVAINLSLDGKPEETKTPKNFPSNVQMAIETINGFFLEMSHFSTTIAQSIIDESMR